MASSLFTRGGANWRGSETNGPRRAWTYAHPVPRYLLDVIEGTGDGGGGKGQMPIQWLSERDDRDLDRMVRDLPTLSFAISERQNRLFGIPFEIQMGLTGQGSASKQRRKGGSGGLLDSIPVNLLREDFRETVIQRYWMPWLRDLDLQRCAKGFAPYYFKPLELKTEQVLHGEAPLGPDTSKSVGRNKDPPTRLVHFVPVTPPVGSGRVGTRLVGYEQELVWEWAPASGGPRAGKIDTRMCWAVEHMPTLEGRYCSRLVPLLSEWRYIQKMRELDVASAIAASQPQHIIEYHPDAAGGTSSGGGGGGSASGIAYLEAAGRAATYPGMLGGGGGGGGGGAMPIEQIESFRADQLGAAGSDVTAEGLVGADMYDAGTLQIDPEAEGAAELANVLRNNPQLRRYVSTRKGNHPPNTFILRPYERHVAVAPPRAVAPNLLQHMARFDRLAALQAGYPLDQVVGATAGSASGSGGRSGGGTLADSASTQQFLVSHLRYLAQFYSAVVRDAYLQAYAVSFRRVKRDAQSRYRRTYGRPPKEHEMLLLERALDIKVIFPRTPMLTREEMAYFYELRMISKDDFFRFSMETLGLEERETPPRGYGEAVDAHFPKVPLEMQQQRLQQKQVEAQIATQSKQLKLQEKQHTDQMKVQSAAAASCDDADGASEGRDAGAGGQSKTASGKRARVADKASGAKSGNDGPEKKKTRTS